jgi:methionine sulfoxide reductase heme-binding subunit
VTVIWYAERSAGIVAYLLLSASVVLGVSMSARWRLAWPRFALEEIHRFVSILTGVFIAMHGLGLLLDQVVPFSLLQVVVPFTSSYRPFAVGLGVASAELLAAIAVTNALRGHITHRVWRRVHYLTIVVWLGTTGHVLLTGTDRQEAWFLALVAVAVASVALAFAARFGGEITAVRLTTVMAATLVVVLGLAFFPQAKSKSATAASVVALRAPTA